MADIHHVVDLKKEKRFIEQYIQLRNHNCDLLVTSPVNVVETREWLKRDDVEIRGIVDKGLLVGIVILFLSRRGEIAFFSRSKGEGLGGKLLSVIEIAAQERGLQEVWAWVLSDNVGAQKAFLKNGYQKKESSTKEHKGKIMTGFVFRKTLDQVNKK